MYCCFIVILLNAQNSWLVTKIFYGLRNTWICDNVCSLCASVLNWWDWTISILLRLNVWGTKCPGFYRKFCFMSSRCDLNETRWGFQDYFDSSWQYDLIKSSNECLGLHVWEWVTSLPFFTKQEHRRFLYQYVRSYSKEKQMLA